VNQTIAIASDHAGFEYKAILNAHLESKGIQVQDFGTYSTEPVDYPDFVRPAAEAVAKDPNTLGIIIGGSGNEEIVANRLRGICCAVVWSDQTARLSKEHGNCNMIAIGQRLLSQEKAISIVDAWLSADFKGGRHQKRIDKIDIK
jgi:ribose 5-phosphate isomerase B